MNSAIWDLTSMVVKGVYLNEFNITGKVESSRVKYGGGIVHTVVLDNPITVYGQIRDRILLDHENVQQVSNH